MGGGGENSEEFWNILGQCTNPDILMEKKQCVDNCCGLKFRTLFVPHIFVLYFVFLFFFFLLFL